MVLIFTKDIKVSHMYPSYRDQYLRIMFVIIKICCRFCIRSSFESIQKCMEKNVFFKVSKACTSLCQWVRAMHKYHFVAKNVAPKRAALAEAQAELAESQRILDAAKARLYEVEEGIATLQAKLNECVSKKEDLERKTNECEQRLVRAGKLIGGLADEKDRWQSSVAVSFGSLFPILHSRNQECYITGFFFSSVENSHLRECSNGVWILFMLSRSSMNLFTWPTVMILLNATQQF